MSFGEINPTHMPLIFNAKPTFDLAAAFGTLGSEYEFAAQRTNGCSRTITPCQNLRD